jgi:hypothetical protein
MHLTEESYLTSPEFLTISRGLYPQRALRIFIVICHAGKGFRYVLPDLVRVAFNCLLLIAFVLQTNKYHNKRRSTFALVFIEVPRRCKI